MSDFRLNIAPLGVDNEAGAASSLHRLPCRAPVIVPPSASLRDTLYRMNQAREDAAVIVDEASSLPLGLVTLRDLVHIISFEGGELDAPVAGSMIAAPLTIPADAPPHRAKVMMAKRSVRHLLLVDGAGRLAGIISQADLFGPRAADADDLVGAIAAARDVEAMAIAADSVRRHARELFSSGMAVEALCQWMSGLNDLVGMRIIELIEDEFDLPPVSWCWMVFGSEGRLEQTLVTDQDNGLIFQPADPAATEETRNAFLPFARAVNEALHYCGFERCRGKIMAGNPKWCLSEAEWRAQFESWLRTPTPDALMHGAIFFDFRPLYGSQDLVDRLRSWLAPKAPEYPLFFRALTEDALTCAPPVGWAGQFVYDRNKDFPHTIDLKQAGARPFVDAARLWGLQYGAWETSTADRLRVTAPHIGRSPEDTAATIEAFHLVQRFRIHQQGSTQDPDRSNRLDPSDLNELHRLMLKEAFKQAKRIQLRLKQDQGI